MFFSTSKKVMSLISAIALLGTIGVSAAAASNAETPVLTAVEGVVINFEDAVPGELGEGKELDPSQFDGQGVTAANDGTTLIAVEGVTPNFEDAIPGEATAIKELDPSQFDGQGVTAAKGGANLNETGARDSAASAVENIFLNSENAVFCEGSIVDAIPGELVIMEGVTPTVIGEQGVTAAK